MLKKRAESMNFLRLKVLLLEKMQVVDKLTLLGRLALRLALLLEQKTIKMVEIDEEKKEKQLLVHILSILNISLVV